MSRAARPLSIALAVALLVGCGDDGGTPGAADPAEPGPFPVGVRTVELDDLSRPDDGPSRGPRHLVVEVWYPADDAARSMPRQPVLDFLPASLVEPLVRLLGDQVEGLDAITGAVRDAPIARDRGPYPLIVHSHGNAGVRYQNFSLGEHLASHGFVVVAPDHIGNAAITTRADGTVAIINPLLLPISYIDRLFDAGFLIDHFLAAGAAGAGGFFGDTIALGRGVGIAGHSFGAVTAIAYAAVDDRVAASMPMAPAFLPVVTPPLEVPALIWAGTEDRTLGADDATRAFERSTGPRMLAEFVDGGHFTFTDGCEYLGFVFDGDGCGEGERIEGGASFEFVAEDVALPILNEYATAFFRWTLAGDDAMVARLAENPDPRELVYRTADLP